MEADPFFWNRSIYPCDRPTVEEMVTGARGEGSLRGYVSDLVSSEVELFPHSQYVQIQMDLEDCLCTAKVLSFLGLIVNELPTNAMKYTFRDHQNPM